MSFGHPHRRARPTQPHHCAVRGNREGARVRKRAEMETTAVVFRKFSFGQKSEFLRPPDRDARKWW